MRNRLLAILIMVFLFGLAGCGYSKPNLPSQSEAEQNIGPRVLVKSYKMAVGDKLQINVWKNEQLSSSQPIRPDGKISMPLMGDVLAVGLTPEQLAAQIKKRLSRYVKSPNVTVILTSLQGHEFLSRIRVTGSVAHNLSMAYHQGMTVLDAVLEAGSVDIYADANNTKLHRRTKNGSVAYDIRLKDIIKNGDMTTNVTLMPGDIISVPERIF